MPVDDDTQLQDHFKVSSLAKSHLYDLDWHVQVRERHASSYN
jgi:hypothetical protein